jgi:hypothetical protein
MRSQSLRNVSPLLVEKVLCGAVAAAVAWSVIHGKPAPAMAAALVVAGMVAVASGNSTRAGACTRRRLAAAARRPTFHQFVFRRLGSPRRPIRLLVNAFARPVLAPSFGAVWRAWNPPLGYVLLFYVYRPSRRYLPRRAARYVVILVSGVLHDGIANRGGILRGHIDVPLIALFAVFGGLTLLTDAAGVDLSRRPAWVRVLANLSLLAAGFGLRGAASAIAR